EVGAGSGGPLPRPASAVSGRTGARREFPVSWDGVLSPRMSRHLCTTGEGDDSPLGRRVRERVGPDRRQLPRKLRTVVRIHRSGGPSRVIARCRAAGGAAISVSAAAFVRQGCPGSGARAESATVQLWVVVLERE